MEPITAEFIERVIAKEHPTPCCSRRIADGQNAAVELAISGVLDRYGVKMIGCDLAAIERGEDRKLFAVGHGRNWFGMRAQRVMAIFG